MDPAKAPPEKSIYLSILQQGGTLTVTGSQVVNATFKAKKKRRKTRP